MSDNILREIDKYEIYLRNKYDDDVAYEKSNSVKEYLLWKKFN